MKGTMQTVQKLSLLIIAALTVITALPPQALYAQNPGDGAVQETDTNTVTVEEYYREINNNFMGDDLADCGGSSAGAAPITGDLISFIKAYGKMAFDIGKQYGIPYDAILAQAMLESSYGKSKLTTEANNFFGIKAGSSWTGPVYNAQTNEQTPGGGEYSVEASFRAYPNPLEGFRGYALFITENPRYADALKHPNDPIAYITALKAAGYATDVEYVSKNVKILKAVQAYIAKNKLFPPSSAVAPDKSPAGGPGGDGASSGPTASTDGCSSDATGIVGKYAFPLKGRKSVVNNPGMFNNNTADRGGHPYIAFDIMANSGTQVVPFLDGTVQDITTDKCGTTMFSVYNSESDLTISYLHLNAGGIPSNGAKVTHGSQVIATVAPGPCGTGDHLHIDAAKGNSRPGCSREKCPSSNASRFTDIGPQLYETYQALPE